MPEHVQRERERERERERKRERERETERERARGIEVFVGERLLALKVTAPRAMLTTRLAYGL